MTSAHEFTVGGLYEDCAYYPCIGIDGARPGWQRRDVALGSGGQVDPVDG